jgi:hypothetical protein
MIAPPSQGSAIARDLQDVPAYRLLYGPAGQELTPEAMDFPIPTTLPFAIIAGGRGDGEGYNPLLPGDDDGTVAVDEARLPGAAGFLIVPAVHAVISNDARTIAATRAFLGTGRLEASP